MNQTNELNEGAATAKRKNSVILILLVAAFTLLAVVFWPRPRAAANTEVRIAAILNLSGPAARFDAVKQKTLKIAEARVRNLHPETRISIRIFDAGGGGEATTSSVRQAQEWRAFCYLTGTSPTALAVASSLRDTIPQPLHMANAANPDFGPPKPNEFRFWPDWEQEANVIQKTLTEQRLNQLLVIHSADPYSQALMKALRAKLSNSSQAVVLEQQFDPAGAPDFRPILIKAKRQNVTALVIFGLPPGISALANQLAEIGWDAAVVGGVNITLSVQTFAQLKLRCPLWTVETDAMSDNLPSNSEASNFRDSYRREFGEAPPFHSLYLADAVYLLSAAEEKKGETLTQKIEKGVTFECASGTLTLGNDGILTIPMKARRVQ